MTKRMMTSVLLAVSAGAPSARAAVLGYTGSAQTYTVPATGFYDVTAVGGGGGMSSGYLFQPQPGGVGASVTDTLRLTAGQTVTVLVGGRGADPTESNVSFNGAGGGGGTFVTRGGTALLVAGGGGGGGNDTAGGNGGGFAAAGATGAGGTGGGDPFGNGTSGGGGGGGYSTNGANGVSATVTAARGGSAYANGGAGGAGASGPDFPGFSPGTGGTGGFGGGGGGGLGIGGGGGGGGYVGGNGGAAGGGAQPGVGGGGGQSFTSGLTPVSLLGSAGANGSVTINPAVGTTFFASGTFDSGSQLGGTLSIDLLTGRVLDAALTVGSPDGLSFATLSGEQAVNGAYLVQFIEADGTALQLDFQGATTLAGFTGSTFVTGLATGPGVFDELGRGAVRPAAVPEPAALGLAAVGGGWLLGGRRRRPRGGRAAVA